jgi:hypothetical protein
MKRFIQQHADHPQFGFMHLRLQTWLPMTIHIAINGREWLACQLDAAGIGYRRRDNCFSEVEDPMRAQQLLDQQLKTRWKSAFHELLRQSLTIRLQRRRLSGRLPCRSTTPAAPRAPCAASTVSARSINTHRPIRQQSLRLNCQSAAFGRNRRQGWQTIEGKKMGGAEAQNPATQRHSLPTYVLGRGFVLQSARGLR